MALILKGYSFTYSPAKPLNNPTHLSQGLKSFDFVSGVDVNPWLGLIAYTEETKAYFFGRDAEISEMFTRVRDNTLTILFGQSGLGKTSLLGAGLVPKLRVVERFRPVLLRLDFSEDAPPLLAQTRDALCGVLRADTQSPASSLWDILHRTSPHQDGLRAHPPVIIFDQFEELFTQGGTRPGEVAEWFTQISDLVENRPPAALQARFRSDRQLSGQFDLAPTPARIVITLREDYLSHLERWKSVLPSLMRNRMALHPLTGPQALEAAVNPGRLGATPIVSKPVGEQIVRKVVQRPDSCPLEDIEAVPSPFLSLLCEQLNAARLKASPKMEQITAEMVSTLCDDILDVYYEKCFHGQPVALRYYVEDRLVSDAGHRDTVTAEDACNALYSPALNNPSEAIQPLINHRLLTMEERGGIKRLELTHDILAPLVVRSRTARREQEALLAIQRQKLRQVKTIAVMVAVLLVFGGLALFGGISYLRAEKEKRKNQQFLSRSDFLQGTMLLEQDKVSEGMAYLARAIRMDTNNESAVARLYSTIVYRNFCRPVGESMKHESYVRSAQFSPDGRWVVTASMDKTARVWEAATGKAVSEPMEHKDSVSSAQFSPDGRWVVTASKDNTTRVWEAATGKMVSEAMRHEGSVNSAQFSPDSRWVVTASDDMTVRVWETATGKAISVLMGHVYWINAAQFSSDGQWIITASYDKTARVWEAATGKPVSVPMKHDGSVNSAQFSPNGRWVVTASDDNTARVWDATTGKPVSEPMKHEDVVNSAQFSQDGRWVVTASGDTTARVWDAATGKPVSEPMKHEDVVNSAQFSPDGWWVVTASVDKTAHVWEVATGKPVSAPMKNKDGTFSARLNSVVHLVATASFDKTDNKTERVLESAIGKPGFNPMKHDDSKSSAQSSPDGRWKVDVLDDKTVRVWDAETDKAISEPIKSESLESAQFSPDGRCVIVTSRDKTARVWEIVPKGWQSVAEAVSYAGETIARLRLNDLDGLEMLKEDEWLRLRYWMETKTLSAEARQFMEWVLAPSATRRPTPFSEATPE